MYVVDASFKECDVDSLFFDCPFFFFFNDTATTEIYTLSLHDALPIYRGLPRRRLRQVCPPLGDLRPVRGGDVRSEEHTSELQSPCNLVCRLLLEKKKKNKITNNHHIT